MRRSSMRSALWVGVICLGVCLLVYQIYLNPCPLNAGAAISMMSNASAHVVYDKTNNAFVYDRSMPLIFIGGVPRSGTTLMRAMLDAHAMVRCGEETRVLPRLLGMRAQWMKSTKESRRLKEAGLSDSVMNDALAAFMLEIIAKHGEPAPRLCNKDPFMIKSATYLLSLFPNAKFLFMVRDGRATVHSIITRKVTITGFDLTNYRQCLTRWNTAVETMYKQCISIGPSRCLPVYYEQLVLHPETWMRKVLKFLDIPWNQSVLHHDKYIGKEISLSKVERSTDQVIKPINIDALSKWVGNVPDDVVKDMESVAPMLAKLGYDPSMNPPNYGKPDRWVADNTADIHKNKDYWEEMAKKVRSQDLDNKWSVAKSVETPTVGNSRSRQRRDTWDVEGSR